MFMLYTPLIPYMQTLFHIWDCLLFEGSKVCFRVVVGILRQHENFFLEMSSPWRCVTYLKVCLNHLPSRVHFAHDTVQTETLGLLVAGIRQSGLGRVAV